MQAVQAGVQLITGKQQADAIGNQANAQQSEAQAGLQFQEQTRTDAENAAKPSFGQMAAINQQFQSSANLLNSQMGSLQNQLSLYNSATAQAQQLMSGQAASTLGPMQQQQQLQRTQLENQLRDQLGSGYATSSAGSMALANFDMQSQFATSQAQQQATGMYLGAAESLGQGINQTYSTASNINSQGLSAANQLQGLGVSAITNTPVNFNNAIQTAGNQYVGQAAQWQNIGNTASQFLGGISKAANAAELALA